MCGLYCLYWPGWSDVGSRSTVMLYSTQHLEVHKLLGQNNATHTYIHIYKYRGPPRTIIQGRMAGNSASATSGATLKVHLETLCMSSFCLSFNADVAVSFGDHSKLALQMTALTFQLQNFQPHFFGDSAWLKFANSKGQKLRFYHVLPSGNLT